MTIPGERHKAAPRRAVAAAIGEAALRAGLESGVLKQPWRGVIVHADSTLLLRTKVSAAIMAVGPHAVVSGPTALELYGLDAASTADVHLTVPYSRSARSRAGLVLHQDRFSAHDVVEVEDFPIFELTRALADFLCAGPSRTAFAALDQACAGMNSQHLIEMQRKIRWRLDHRDDRRGVNKAFMLSELATGRAESPPESWLRLLVVEAGFPIPEPQYEICALSDGRLLYRLDMAWSERRIALEYDGYAAHEDREASDAERDDRMTARGWIVIRARAADLSDPTELIARLRSAFDARDR